VNIKGSKRLSVEGYNKVILLLKAMLTDVKSTIINSNMYNKTCSYYVTMQLYQCILPHNVSNDKMNQKVKELLCRKTSEATLGAA